MKFMQYNLPLFLVKNGIDTSKDIYKCIAIAMVFFWVFLRFLSIGTVSSIVIAMIVGLGLQVFLVDRIVLKGVSYSLDNLDIGERARELLSAISGTDKGDVYLLVPNINFENTKKFQSDKFELVDEIAKALLPSRGFHGRIGVRGLSVLSDENHAQIDIEFLELLLKKINPEVKYLDLKQS